MPLHLTALLQSDEEGGRAGVALWETCGLTRPWNPPEIDLAHALDNPTSTVFIARANSSAPIIGTVMAGFDGHRGWLYYLAVDPSAQRAGVARALIDAAESWLAEQGARKVQLMVRSGNPAAGLYEHLGYERQETAVYGRWL